MLWLNGKRVPDTVAPFDLRDRGLLLGDGLFDTALAVNGQVVFEARHLDRLQNSCAAFDIPFDRANIQTQLHHAATQIDTGSLRLTITRGPGPRGVLPPADPAPCTVLSANPGAPAPMWRPSTAVTTTIRRNETSPTAHHKCLGYVDAIHALEGARQKGADEALFLNTQGQLACGTVGNVFVLSGDTLKTPPLADGVMPGVVRAELLALAPQLGLTPVETSLTPNDLTGAKTVFTTNSLRLISPVVSLDGCALAFQPALHTLAQGLIAHIEQTHGPAPWMTKGLDVWPTLA